MNNATPQPMRNAIHFLPKPLEKDKKEKSVKKEKSLGKDKKVESLNNATPQPIFFPKPLEKDKKEKSVKKEKSLGKDKKVEYVEYATPQPISFPLNATPQPMRNAIHFLPRQVIKTNPYGGYD